MRHSPALLLALLALPACQSSRRAEPGAQPVSGIGVDRLPMAATLTVHGADGREGPFALDTTSSLVVEARVTYAPPGPHELRLDVLSPEGTLYAQLPATFQADESGAGTVVQELQVGGTSIDQYRRAGTWTVSASLDGAEQPLAAADAKLTE